MKTFSAFLCCVFCGLFLNLNASTPTQTITVEWGGKVKNVSVSALNGTIGQISTNGGKSFFKPKNDREFAIPSSDRPRIIVRVDSANISIGPDPTLIRIQTDLGSFSFFLRDVNAQNPIYIPQYKVVVLPGQAETSYEETEKTILARKNRSKIQRIEQEPEVSFETAAQQNRKANVPIWLGLSRDMRMFEVSEELEDSNLDEKMIRPINSSASIFPQETAPSHLYYQYTVGRGMGVRNNIHRRLEDGSLPIYHSELKDDDIVYHTLTFASFEKSPLNEQTLTGTDFMISDKHSGGRVFTPQQQKILDEKLASLPSSDQEVVLFSRCEISNTGTVPRYAWLKIPHPGHTQHQFDTQTGFSSFSEDKVFCISRLNAEAPRNKEIAVLLQPGERLNFDFFIPHTPVSKQRAEALAACSFEEKYAECKSFWNGKLDRAATIKLPEKRIEEMLRAGLLHLDLITFGTNDPNAPLAANVGVYSPIGTESAPIIQFYTSMGWNETAKRSLDYFLETQQDDGRIMNYFGYTIETGAVLWSLGEYFRYTCDEKWVQEIAPKVIKACNYLIQWRKNSQREELIGRGYGMIDGKVADPEDPFHQFMLNGYGYMGLSRAAEILAVVKSPEAQEFAKEAQAWRNDIRNSATQAMALSPVVPLGDGTWVSTLPPWTESEAPRVLYLKPEVFRSHGTFTVADAMLGPLYLVFCEVFDPQEPMAQNMFAYHSELLFQENSAFSQPYYSKHNWYQAQTGMVKPFLSTYYNTVTPHADHETYTFWEHMYKLSPHKTHEEGNFLMETRWMLYMEDGDTLNLFRVIPRAWLADGKQIELSGVQSYFGRLNVKVDSHVDGGYIDAFVECDPKRKPESVAIRLPHPEYKKPVKVTGGVYDEASETVWISPVNGRNTVRLEF